MGASFPLNIPATEGAAVTLRSSDFPGDSLLHTGTLLCYAGGGLVIRYHGRPVVRRLGRCFADETLTAFTLRDRFVLRRRIL